MGADDELKGIWESLSETADGFSSLVGEIGQTADQLELDKGVFADTVKMLAQSENITGAIGKFISLTSNPAGIAALVAGTTLSLIVAALKADEEHRTEAMNGFFDTITLSKKQEQMFLNYFAAGLSGKLAEAQSAFSKIANPDGEKSLDELDVQQKMMEIALREGTLAPEQAETTIASMKQQFTDAEQTMEVDYQKAQAEIELRYEGEKNKDVREEKLKELSGEYGKQQQQLSEKKDSFSNLIESGYEEKISEHIRTEFDQNSMYKDLMAPVTQKYNEGLDKESQKSDADVFIELLRGEDRAEAALLENQAEGLIKSGQFSNMQKVFDDTEKDQDG
jgi:hypothetical protein